MPPRSEYGRTTRDGKQIWYVLVDESGHPYYDEEDTAPFTMGAIITGDPRNAMDVLNKGITSNRGTILGEHKHSHSGIGKNGRIMDAIVDDSYALVATDQPIYNQTDYSKDVSGIVYLGTASRLLNEVARAGPPGIYRIRFDESEYVDESELELIARAAFSGYNDRELAEHSPVSLFDSAFNPPIQMADAFIGEYRRALKRGNGEDFAKRHGIFLANRKRKR